MANKLDIGRVNQKERTRATVLDAARALVRAGGDVSMPLVASAARVSEATAYRYFPDLASLLAEAVHKEWPSASEVMRPVAHHDDPVQRIAHAVRAMLTDVRDQQAAVRVMMASAITRPRGPAIRPARRFGLIDEALAPLPARLSAAHRRRVEQLRRDLTIVVSAEAYFNLIDLCGLSPEEAINSVVATARTLTAAALTAIGWAPKR
jgi:AcrR family transcriptional regulator